MIIPHTSLPSLRQADGLLGSAMTYSLFELAKEKADEMVVDSPETVTEDAAVSSVSQDSSLHKGPY